jgi:hypothetical protein
MRPEFCFKPLTQFRKIEGTECPCAPSSTDGNHQMVEGSILVKKATDLQRGGGINHRSGGLLSQVGKGALDLVLVASRDGHLRPGIYQEVLDRYLSHLLDQNPVTFANFFPLTNDRKVYETTQRSLS